MTHLPVQLIICLGSSVESRGASKIDPSVSSMGRVVLCSGEVSIENTDERVTRKVLQAMIDYHHMPIFLPG
jgi:hypothetical protein